METLEEGASTEEADTETPQAEETEESLDDEETSEDGSQEDADETENLKKQLSDKDTHIVDLETQLREKSPVKKEKKSKVEGLSEDDVIWLNANASDLKMCPDEYKAYREKGYEKDDALHCAKRDKGLLKVSEAKSTSSEGQDETRKGKPKAKKPTNFIGDQEQYDRIQAKKAEEKKALGK